MRPAFLPADHDRRANIALGAMSSVTERSAARLRTFMDSPAASGLSLFDTVMLTLILADLENARARADAIAEREVRS